MNVELRRQLRGFAVAFLLIALCMGLLALSVAGYNRQEHTMTLAEQSEETDAYVTIGARGGSSDSWLKRIAGENGEELLYAGITYDIVVRNQTGEELRDWTLLVEATTPCYINNAWCGSIEFHQHTDAGELVQTIDLRKVIELGTEVTVNHTYLDENLAIALDEGDSFLYLPSERDKEDVIGPADLSKEEYQTVRVGFITYHQTLDENDLTPVEFTDATFAYHLHRYLTDMPLFQLLCGLAFLWLIGLTICLVVDHKTRRLMREAENDARIIKQTMATFMGFIDAKDESTDGHSKRVAVYSERIARKLGLSHEEVHRIYYIALMHDCGKIGIPDAILSKPGRLTPEEYEVIKTHTVKGGKILKDFNSIPGIRDGVMYHHERYDGKGYPEGLKGEEIPLVARIICMADSFDAMNSDRCYRERLSREQILQQIRENRGTQFDPKIADCMLELLTEGEITFSQPTQEK